MNTLVTLGAGASFGVSCIAAGLPQLGWKTFFEEPAMLLGFVLVGRALEERAKLQASADMAALQVILRLASLQSSICSSDSCQCMQKRQEKENIIMVGFFQRSLRGTAAPLDCNNICGDERNELCKLANSRWYQENSLGPCCCMPVYVCGW